MVEKREVELSDITFLFMPEYHHLQKNKNKNKP
jgi:hypothetical protein